MTLTYGSLFSGIGGMDLGFDRAGMECAWQVEINDYCQRVLAKHWPDVPKYKDVKDVGKRNLSAVDVVIGGFPCQPHSLAGKRKGAADDRNLWPEYRRIVTELRPAWVVGENVPGLKHTMLDEIISDLESANYEVATFNIPAIAFDAPHKRERLFIVANSESNGRSSINNGIHENKKQNGRNKTNRKVWRHQGYVFIPSIGRTYEKLPRINRVAHGVPNRVDRLKGLGNAVVPQVAEFIARQIVAVEEST